MPVLPQQNALKLFAEVLFDRYPFLLSKKAVSREARNLSALDLVNAAREVIRMAVPLCGEINIFNETGRCSRGKDKTR